MKIAIASALFPPDIAIPAPYIKELATRLKNEHSVTVLIYNHLPEHIDGVAYVVVEKSKTTFIRIAEFVRALWKITKESELVLVQNGAATELPLILVSFFVHKKLILTVSDPKTTTVNNSNWIFKSIHILASMCAYKIIVPTDTAVTSPKMHVIPFPFIKPEILPFEPYPTAAIAEYEASWKKHLHELIARI